MLLQGLYCLVPMDEGWQPKVDGDLFGTATIYKQFFTKPNQSRIKWLSIPIGSAVSYPDGPGGQGGARSSPAGPAPGPSAHRARARPAVPWRP